MHLRLVSIALVALICGSASRPAAAGLLASFTLEPFADCPSGPCTGSADRFGAAAAGIAYAADPDDPYGTLYAAPAFSGIGDTAVLDPGQAGFPELAALLTNGVDEVLEPRILFYSDPSDVPFLEAGIARSESSLFGTTADLFGNTVSSIEFTLVALDLASPGTDRNGDGIWTDIDRAIVRVDVLGDALAAVPEPTTLWLFGGGLLLLGMSRRRAARGYGPTIASISPEEPLD